MKQKELKEHLKYYAYDEKQAEELTNLLKPYLRKYPQNITGDACKGDKVCYVREIWGGSYRRPKFEGFKIETGTITNDSYGKSKQQHTFTILLDCGGYTYIKGRNLYKYITLAKKRNEEERKEVLKEKHKRGKLARAIRDYRNNIEDI